MKNFFVADAIKCADDPQRYIQAPFLVVSKQRKPKKNGGDYLAMVLCDRTGQIEAKMWDNIEQFANAFDADDIVNVKCYVNRYNGRPQLILLSVSRLEAVQVDFGDFLPKTSKNIDELWARLSELAASVAEPHLVALLQSFLGDADFAAAFRTAPAAKSLHHATIGGLLEHVVSLMNLCDRACGNYPATLVNRDLLLCGAFLHDIGKIHELYYQRAFGYTTRGQLLGHMIIELEMLQQKIAGVQGFPDGLKTLLEHLIISHHGQYEFGSPKLPMFPEALMLHYLDDLDSKMESMRAQFEREISASGPWAGYNSSLERNLLNSRKFLDEGTKQADAQVEATATE
ncbi:MAG: OB-fold nucleic acid binding domain-containing protein [Terriglobales bacterium]|jgi:3'-5' exoribonuclease